MCSPFDYLSVVGELKKYFHSFGFEILINRRKSFVIIMFKKWSIDCIRPSNLAFLHTGGKAIYLLSLKGAWSLRCMVQSWQVCCSATGTFNGILAVLINIGGIPTGVLGKRHGYVKKRWGIGWSRVVREHGHALRDLIKRKWQKIFSLKPVNPPRFSIKLQNSLCSGVINPECMTGLFDGYLKIFDHEEQLPAHVTVNFVILLSLASECMSVVS